MMFEIKYLIGNTPMAEPFPDVLVSSDGAVTTGTSYFTSSNSPYTLVSNGETIDISEDTFSEAKKMYYMGVDPTALIDAKNSNPNEFVSIEDILNSLPDQV